jgi:hypothetical protein
MKLTWAALKQTVRGERTSRPEGKLEPSTVKQMARGIMTTRDDEIDCTECFEQVDQFVEMKLAGKNAAEAMPLVQDHLDRCGNCREEFEALLAALRAVN